jgi:general stress protein 26
MHSPWRSLRSQVTLYGIVLHLARVGHAERLLLMRGRAAEIVVRSAMDTRGRAEFEKLRELIESVQIALLTTIDLDGCLHTRPVETLRVEPDGTLWFFTDWHSPKANELRQDVRVSVGYAHPAKSTYVAVSGTGRLLRDTTKARELWTPTQRAWYPQGVEDERLALLCVTIERAEYWLTPGRVSYAFAALKAMVTRQPTMVGEDHKLS